MRRFLTILVLAILASAGPALAGPLAPDDQYYPYEWYGSVLGLPEAWGISLGSSSVTVAVLDTGVISTTPDLLGRVKSPLAAPGLPILNGMANRHGTWVASVAAMRVNNIIGGAGVGNFSILPITVADANGATSPSYIANGIRMAANAGARAINVSYLTDDYQPLDEAAAYARSKGALTFVAAGNSNDLNPMSGYDNLIFVSGTNAKDLRWDNGVGKLGSTWGPFVDLSAPADDIVVADPTFESGYGWGDGTSFAAPLAAGAAALVWSINPSLTPDEVQNILYTTADDLGPLGWDEVYGWGRLDIGAAAERAYEMTLTPEPGTLLLLAAGLAAPLARRLRRRP